MDANGGASAAIAEMLVQSHKLNEQGQYIIHILPALPKAWQTGSISGLKARGNHEISMSWKKWGDYRFIYQIKFRTRFFFKAWS